MAITRAAVEKAVVGVCGPLLALADKNVTFAGANPDLNDPLAFTLQALGVTPTDPTAAADVDLASLGNDKYPVLCQVTAYYAIERALSSLVMPNEQAQDRRQDWNEMVRRFQVTLATLAARYSTYLNIKTLPTTAGTLPIRFPTPLHRERFGIGHGRIDH